MELHKVDSFPLFSTYLAISFHPTLIFSPFFESLAKIYIMKGQGPYILLAEDDPDDRLLLEMEFVKRALAASIRTVCDGSEVMGFLEACRPGNLPRLILLDYQMPKISGPEILQILQDDLRYQAIPKAVWSASSRTKEMEECLHGGARRYFLKPSNQAELEKIVDDMIRLAHEAAYV